MAEGETIGATGVQIGADMTPLIQELEKMRQETEKRISALALAINAPMYALVRGLQEIFGTMTSAIMAPFRLVQTGLDAIFGPMQAKMAVSLGDWAHWSAAVREAEVNQARFNAVLAGVGPVLGYTADELAKMRGFFAEKTGFSGGAIRDAQQQLIQLQNIRGENIFRAMQVAMDLAARSGGDVAEAASQIGRALVNPEHGMMRLRHAGIMFTEQQKQQIEALQASGDVFKTQSALLDMLSQKVGSVAAAVADTAEGKLDRLGRSWAILGRKIWEFVTPLQGAMAEVATTLVTTLTGAITPTFDKFTATTKSWADSIHKFLTENKQTFMVWGDLARNIIGNVVSFISGALSNLFPAYSGSAASTFWEGVTNAITNFLGLLSAASQNMPLMWEAAKMQASLFWDSVLARGIQIWDSLADIMKNIFIVAWDAVINSLNKKISSNRVIQTLAELVSPGSAARLINAAGGPAPPIPQGAGGPLMGPSTQELLEGRRDEAIAKALQNTSEAIAKTANASQFLGRRGEPVTGQAGGGGMFGIEAYSHHLQEGILEGTAYAAQTADNTAKTAEGVMSLIGLMSSGALGGSSAMASTAAVFASP